MDFLNSQLLTYQDGYLHVFRAPGVYEYRILFLPPGYENSEPDTRYTINVSMNGSATGKGSQHDVVLHWNADQHAYLPDPESVTAHVNDYVLWHVETDTLAAPPYGIRGESNTGTEFDSRDMGQHDVLTHMFLLPGEYHYRVNNQSEGVVRVESHKNLQYEVHAERASKAPLVHIVRGIPNPRSLEIVTGQTVVWFVEEGEHVTVTLMKETDSNVRH
jgi:plastocyanin